MYPRSHGSSWPIVCPAIVLFCSMFIAIESRAEPRAAEGECHAESGPRLQAAEPEPTHREAAVSVRVTAVMGVRG